MNSEQFYYWLNGFIDTMETDRPSVKQWKAIKAHAALVAVPTIFENKDFIPDNIC